MFTGLFIAGLALALLAAFSSVAFAQHYYAGNQRSLGAGVKAEIRTPSSTPVLRYNSGIANFVTNYDVHDGDLDWV